MDMATASGEELHAHDSEYEDLDVPDEEDGVGHGDSIKKQNRWQKVVKEGLVVPYRTVHAPPCSFKTPHRKCFIPGRPVFAKILRVERCSVSTYLLNPNLYVIQLQHGPYTWIIKRRYKHFQHLHQQLLVFKVTMRVPLPTKTHTERRTSYKTSMEETTKNESGKPSRRLPRFPIRPEALVASDQIEERRKALERYLQDMLKIRAFRNHHETMEFLEVSQLSFIYGLGDKGKEGLIQKRTGTTHARRCTFKLCACLSAACLGIQRRCCGGWCGHWQRRWLVAKETFVAYIRPKDGVLHCVMLVDSEFEASTGRNEEGISNGIVISNLTRKLVVKCWTKRKAKEWLDHCRQLSNSESARAFIGPNRFTSYAPVRNGVDAEWFVDGATYMSAVADVLEAAHEEIYISDWWLSPEIYMKRPVVEGETWRLDKILQRKAKEGVKIFVLLYKEVNLALGINSFYSKQKLVEQNSDNIKVLRHPDHVSAGVLLWAHHEKLVVVDQSYAFVGGIDLCYGRWDDHIHRLTDLGSISAGTKVPGAYYKKMTSSKPYGGEVPSSIFQLAQAASSVTIGPIVKATGNLPGSIPDMTLPAPLEDSEGNQITEEDVKAETGHVSFADIMPHPEEYELEGSVIKEENENEEDSEATGEVPLKGETPPPQRKLMRKVTKVTKEIRDATRDLKEDGKDWVNKHLRRKDSKDLGGSATNSDEEKDDKSEDESKEGKAREPKARAKRSASQTGHEPLGPKVSDTAEVGLLGCSKLWMGKDYTNFIVKDFADLESPFTDLVNRSTTPRMPWHDLGMMVQGIAARDVARHFIQRWNAVKDEKVPLNHSYPYLLPKSYDIKGETFSACCGRTTPKYKVSCQVVRSMSKWSGGIRMIEESIQQAYIEVIEDAKHYIYIENQFFITLASANQQVQNRIGEALLQRILRAHREKKVFRVFVVIPLLPGFEGEVGTNRGIAIHAITHWNYSSICKGPDSLIVRLEKAGVEDPSQYVTFHGLRTHSELQGDLVTELIYVHSKLMIVDDSVVICGSANINDRSLTGKRDSEVCLVLQDETFVDARMNGEEFKAGNFGQSLRMNLFREHLGLDESTDITDPLNEEFYRNVWIKTATKNTEIFEKVFHCVPTNSCVNFLQLQEYQREHPLAVTDSAAAATLLNETIKGHLVLLPLLFLRDENLLPSPGTKEALMPTQLWT